MPFGKRVSYMIYHDLSLLLDIQVNNSMGDKLLHRLAHKEQRK